MAIALEIVSRETIKPSSPTPPHLKIYNFSVVDKSQPSMYVPLLFFYPGTCDTNRSGRELEINQKLKTSLSETLKHFYPFAGRIKGNDFIECNDHGVEYIEARINCSLEEVIEEPELDELEQFLPISVLSSEGTIGFLLLVQATFFECGAVALCLSVSHKVGDAATYSAFINFWAATASRSSEVMISPVFMGASIFPPIDSSIPQMSLEFAQQKPVTKRFVFDAHKLAKIRIKAANKKVPQPSRIEAVSALIWKCVVTASRSKLGYSSRPSVWALSVNLRTRLVPPLPENYAGNYAGMFLARLEGDELDLHLHDLVYRIRKGKKEVFESYAEKAHGDEVASTFGGFVKSLLTLASSNDVDMYACTSWCKFELYEADFGFGRPIWLSIPGAKFVNSIVLTDTKDGNGVEAWVTLTKGEMALMESNEELLEFAAVNPSIL
ncbi:hypothetical protein K2173_005901 [Erythroxylum novogranatense]|uniref:BAHD acyltransferase n=1 Tax=Erythroxylum novogranatense TaxID=1862640 RepID=A0AAV8U6T3_9ROSI|nr:hypothetical protein K2173_005901 [Erythroxylum novogranatense]